MIEPRNISGKTRKKYGKHFKNKKINILILYKIKIEGGNYILEKPSMKSLAILFIFTLLTFVLSLIYSVNNMYVFIALFIVNFFIVAITSTLIIYPSYTFVELFKKPIHMITLSIAFTLFCIIFTKQFLELNSNKFLFVFSIIATALIIFAILRVKRRHDDKSKTIEDYVDKSIAESTYALIIYCLVSFVGMNVPPFSVLPLWFGLSIPFIMFIPGYLIMNTLIPRREEIEFVERAATAIFISLIMTSIIGIIVVQVNHYLNMRVVSLILDLITLFILLPAYILRTRTIEVKKRYIYPSVDKLFIVLGIIGLIIVLGSGVYVNSENINPINQGNTTFTISGVGGTADADGYYNFTDGENLTLKMNITNKENKDMTYKISVQTHNNTTNEVISEYTKKVKDGKSAVVPTNLTMTPGKKDITFVLYDDKNQAYKIRHLYANVESSDDYE
ncbi:MAG: hypothetical protein BZ136_03455 [Methanosphaera sp. rholeuAM74]|nr:MAG: hypothetical protein BZ136_03455 [Methanosphaera sp. rholeuAM74]